MSNDAEYPEYDAHKERSTGRSYAQPNGVTASPQHDASHRSKMARQGSADFEDTKSVSQEVNDRVRGDVAVARFEDEPDPSEIHPDHDALSIEEKSAIKYGKYWTAEQRTKFLLNKTDLPRSAFPW